MDEAKKEKISERFFTKWIFEDFLWNFYKVEFLSEIDLGKIVTVSCIFAQNKLIKAKLIIIYG